MSKSRVAAVIAAGLLVATVSSIWAYPSVNNGIYRAYRVPYDWVPQLDKPEEIAVMPAEGMDFRVVPPMPEEEE